MGAKMTFCLASVLYAFQVAGYILVAGFELLEIFGGGEFFGVEGFDDGLARYV